MMMQVNTSKRIWYLLRILVVWAITCSIFWGSPVMASDISSSRGELRLLTQPRVALEWLEFRVDAAERDDFLRKDEQIWTAALQQQPGFLHKSVVLSPNDPEFVGFLIYWSSREEWKAFPEELLVELDRQMQPTSAVLTRSLEYQSWSNDAES
ncbi:MAG: TIGR03792 family protein [Cyanobacteria bacterium J06649_11]